jgi:ribonuclease P protein component
LQARLGIAVGRRFGNAVQRNRIKRLIREAFRRLRPALPPGTDWVAVPQTARQANLSDIEQSFIQLAARLLKQRSGRVARSDGGESC